MIPQKHILKTPIICLPFEEQIMLMVKWAKTRKSKIVCLANVHMVMEAYWNPQFAHILSQADLVTPDGMPLVWMLRMLGIKHQNRVAGMDIFLNLCDLAQQTGIKVYFLGSQDSILQKIKQKLEREYPVLQIAGMKVLPFLSLEKIVSKKDTKLIAEINQTGAGIVFVCLGCPKQETWMAEYQDKIQGVMIGVGAVFSMYAETMPRAPYYMQQLGLEWLYRLLQEPRRLWRRYASTIPSFLYLASRQLLIPYEDNLSKARWRLSERNVGVEVETLDFSPEKLGEILIRQQVITTEDLEQTLSQQKLKQNCKIGEILVRSNLISLSQLKFYLKNQNIKLGELLIEKKIFKRRSLNNILSLQSKQSKTNKKIGEIILEQGIVSQYKLRELLIEQYVRRKGLFLTSNVSNSDELFLGFKKFSNSVKPLANS